MQFYLSWKSKNKITAIIKFQCFFEFRKVLPICQRSKKSRLGIYLKEGPQQSIFDLQHSIISDRYKIKIIFFFFIIILSLFHMKHLTQYFLPIPDTLQLGQRSQHFTLKYNAKAIEINIDQKMRLKIDDTQFKQIVNFKSDCQMVPFFNQKKVSSISIYLSYDFISIQGQSNSMNWLYEKLARVLSHKGFNQYFKPIKRLGRGTFATVYLVEHRNTGERLAAKVFSKEGQKIQYKGRQALQNQIRTLKFINHPNLIKYDGVYETDSLIYLVTEYLSGGTLEDTLKNRMNFSGQFIQSVIKDILSGLLYLDENCIMHRDIKPENVILREQDNKWVVSDFGLAAKSNEEYLYDKCGTMGYIAPQIMGLQQNEKYAQSCDTYSLGVIAYQLIVGELPFKVQSINLFDKKIIWLLFDREECKDINPLILSFLKGLLDKNPETRLTPKQALQSPFFNDENVVGSLISFHQQKRKDRYERILKLANLN